MSSDPGVLAEQLRAAGVDATLSVGRMVTAARQAGVRGQTNALKVACRQHRARAGLPVAEQRPPQTCRRADAAGLLGVSVKRVDQLRAAGRLSGTRHPFTGTVWLTLESVRAERHRRGMDAVLTTEVVAP